ncbi:hypothetical protein like AT4G11860 [Hibiscus trionum]|uniref:MINDY deubiquitinase domain-containing protein n=1 Tax=Hibiscus trionum TaxID=183268 RepID=A0A9W7JAG2_HIBTR|nr:hypothetical protein like AT4G11860 [Hibiscus trionum]
MTGNVLLLSNNMNLSPDIAEVSQEKLLSLVAESLIDSNSNVDNRDAGYVENQCRNIADAIDLLPRLATGIDVNIKFRRTDDFEFTSECAIFDLLDIPLYHGWIVDPQDYETACAIGSKSYNAVMEELVALEARNMEALRKNKPGDCVDFAAPTTVTLPNDVVEKSNVVSPIVNGSIASMDGKNTEIPQGVEKFETQFASSTNARDITDNVNECDTTTTSSVSLQNADSDSSSGRIHHRNVPGSGPIYEGEESIVDSATTTHEHREPLYEGDAILAKQANKRSVDDCSARPKDEITPQQGELIENFLKNNASQFTFYGLVLFRSLASKFDSSCFRVNGDTLFMTGNFKEFKVDDSHATSTWDEQNAMATTADYIASIDTAVQAGMDINSDLQLAIALQQQEFEEEPPPRPPPPNVGGSRLVTSPQRRRSSGRSSSSSSSSSSPKRDEKSKDMCIVM